MTAVVNVNGRICNQQDAVISVFDHGFVFGDGVYEVLRTYNRRPFLFDAHQLRLRESAARIALAIPWTDGEMLDRLQETLAALPGAGEAYIRVLLTRGVGELTYDPAACSQPTLVMIVKPLAGPSPEVYDRGVTVALVDVLRNHPLSLNPRIKSNNLLNNALAMQEALRRGAFEALMRNYRGEIVECSQSNFFVVKDGVALTPPLDDGLLAGVTRALILELGAGCGVEVREAHIHERDLETASEAFLTSTTREVVPVIRVDARPIGSGTPGPVTRRIIAAFRQHAAAATGVSLQS